jgi:hypothetical protein
MAIRPEIALQAQVANLPAAVMGGLQIGENIRNRGVRDTILRQDQQMNQLKMSAAMPQYKLQLWSDLKNVPFNERAGRVAQSAELLQMFGGSENTDLSDAGLDVKITTAKNQILSMNELTGKGAATANQQKGASYVVRKEDGSQSIATNVFNPNTGKTEVSYAPIEGTLASSTGETPEQKSARDMRDYLTKKGYDVDAFKSQLELENAYAQEKAFESSLGTSRGQEAGAEESFYAQQQRKDAEYDAMTKAEVDKAVQLGKAALELKQRGIAISVEEENAIKTAQAIVQRNNAAIEIGVDASKGLKSLRRSRELLDTISTGGWNAVSYTVRSKLGLEGADEGELANSMGKAVLSQLRSTFGAQFTEKEGRLLMDIEAGWSKSTASNKRLLDNALEVVETAMKGAEKRARDAGDIATADELKAAWDAAPTSWSDDDSQIAPPAQKPIEAVDANGNTIVYNPTTRQWEAK